MHPYLLECLLKCRLQGPTPRLLIEQNENDGLRICFSRKFPEDTDTAGVGITCGESLEYEKNSRWGQKVWGKGGMMKLGLN